MGVTRDLTRGDVVWVDFGSSRANEPEGRRPALIVQNDVGNMHSPNTIVVAITRTIKKYPVNVVVEPEESGLPGRSMVDCSLVLTIARERILQKAGTLGATTIADVGAALKTSLAL